MIKSIAIVGMVACALLACAPAYAQASTRPAPDASSESGIDEGASEPGMTGLGGTGRPTLQLRPRFYYTDQTNKPRNAEAANMRTMIGYRTGSYGGISLTGQLINVSWVNPKRATNSPGDRTSPYPLIADPEKSDMNALYAEFSGLPNTRVRLGRQAIKLDNERFVGDADVRQMPQVFDALSLRNTSIPNTDLFMAHAWHVRTVFGERLQTRTTLLNGRFQGDTGPSLSVYTYLQDQERIHNVTRVPDNSNRISGGRVEGELTGESKLRWYYTAEAAVQRPYADGDQRVRATYLRLGAGPTFGQYSAQLNYERLGSNQGRYGLQTLLTFNTFQGWAYEFFTTPPEGIRDFNASVAATSGNFNVRLKFHRFLSVAAGRILTTCAD